MVIKLYGKIEDSVLKYRFTLIEKESLTLEIFLQKGEN